MKKFSGFTLAEVMISLTIIAVIMVFYVPVHRIIANQYTTLAYAAYENLSLVSKELLSGVANFNTTEVEIATAEGTQTVQKVLNMEAKDHSVTVENEKKPAVALVNRQYVLNPDTVAFCNNFAEVMNISRSPNCPSSESGYSGVSGSSPLSFKLTDVDWDNPNFIGTNGQKYFISAHQDQDDNVSKSYGYRVIAIDLNGKKGPNHLDQYPTIPSRPDDIVYFIMTDNGAVYPIGVAATNRNYINTRTIAYYYSIVNVPSELKEKKAKGCKNLTAKDGINDFKDFFFTDSYIDNKFKIHDSDSDEVKQEKTHILDLGCNFWKDNLLSGDPNHSDETTYSYQMGFCLKNGQTADFQGYNCTGNFAQNSVCNMTNSNRADECTVELIKPVYKIKF